MYNKRDTNTVSEQIWKEALAIIHKQAQEINNLKLENNGLRAQNIDYNRACHSARWALQNIDNQEDECWKGTRLRALRNLDTALPN